MNLFLASTRILAATPVPPANGHACDTTDGVKVGRIVDCHAASTGNAPSSPPTDLAKGAAQAAGDAAKAVGGAVLQPIWDMITKGVHQALGYVLGLWTKVPQSPFDDNTPGSNLDKAGPVAHMHVALGWITAATAVICLLVKAGQLAGDWRRGANERHAFGIGRGLLIYVIATAIAVPVANAIMSMSDQFAQWIIKLAAGDDPTKLGGVGDAIGALEGIFLLMVGPTAILICIVQVMLLITRHAVVGLLLGFLPWTAATGFLDGGWHAFRRLSGWLLAALLYPMIAASIYAFALWTVSTSKDFYATMGGFAMMLLAVIALPALLRLVSPMTAAGGTGGESAAAMTLGEIPAAAAGGLAGAVSLSRAGLGATQAMTQQPSGAKPVGSNGGAGPAGAAGAAGAAGVEAAKRGKQAVDRTASNGGNPGGAA